VKFKTPLTAEYEASFEEQHKTKGKTKAWKFEVKRLDGGVCTFPPTEEPAEFWTKKTFREGLREDLVKFIPDFQPQNPQNRSEVKQNADRVDRVVGSLCTEIEKIIKEFDDSLMNAKWKQLKYDPELYSSVTGFLADLNNISVGDIVKYIQNRQRIETNKLKKQGKNMEVTPEEIADNLLFIHPPNDVLSFFAGKLDSILQAHNMLFEDKTSGTPIHRFKEELVLCIATVLSYWIGREPKWILLIGPSRNFKSTHINYLEVINKIITYEVDMMTTNALMSGAEDVDSFMRLLDEKTQLMDEMGTFLSMRKDVVVKILAEYCVAYKGRATKLSGSAKTSETVYARFNWLAGITNEKFQELFDLFRTIGSRFITFEFPVYSDKYYHELIDGKNAARVKGKEKVLKRMIGSYVYGMYKWLKDNPPAVDSSKVDALLIEMSNFYTIFRDREPPLWFRQMLTDLASIIAVMFNRKQIEREDVEMLVSSTFSCNKKIYLELVKTFAANAGGLEVDDIMEVLPTYRANHIKGILLKLERDGFLEESAEGYVARDEWKNVMEMIRNHLVRTEQLGAYTMGKTQQSRDEYLPAKMEDNSDGDVIY